MIFDWKNNKTDALRNGISEREVQCLNYTHITMTDTDSRVEGHTFRSFPRLEFEKGTEIVGCVFEDCTDLAFDECRIEGCTFRQVWSVTFQDCKVENSRFEKLYGDSGEIIELENSTLSHCAFEDVELRGESYLCGVYNKSMVGSCSFKKIRTDRDDGELFHCKKKKERKERKWGVSI